MDKPVKPRGRCCNLISLAILTVAIYFAVTIGFMLTLYRLVVIQTAQMQTFETVVSDFAARIHKLETSFTKQKTVRKSDRNVQNNAMQVSGKIVRSFAKQKPSLLLNELPLLHSKFMHTF